MQAAPPKQAPDTSARESSPVGAANSAASWMHAAMASSANLIHRQSAWIEALAISLDCESSDRAAAHIASQLHASIRSSRVAVSLLTASGLKLVASSQQVNVNQSGSQGTLAIQAMQEAIDQDAVVLFPSASNTLIITDAHEQLVGGRTNTHVLSIPLVHCEEIIGVALFELRKQEPWDNATRQFAEQLCAGVAPVLALHAKASRSLRQHFSDSVGDWVRRLMGPERLTMKFMFAAGLTTLLLLAIIPMHRSVIADAEVSPTQRHLVSSPASGLINSVHVRSGDIVAENQLLLTLDSRDLLLKVQRKELEVKQLSAESRSAMADHDRNAMAVVQAKLDRARAELSLVNLELERAQIKAPHSGYVVGDALSKATGAPISRGDALLQIMPASGHEVHLLVPEAEISEIKVGSTGKLALKSAPGEALAFVVDSIQPIAESNEGHTRFRAVASVNANNESLRPGQTGLAHIKAERRSVLRVLTWRLSHWASELWWAWFG